MTTKSLEYRREVTESGQLQLSLVEVELPELAEDEILIRVEAAPVNPSDLPSLIGLADKSTLKVEEREGASARTKKYTTASFAHPAAASPSQGAGHEGSGVVEKTGSSAAAQMLKGLVVSFMWSTSYSQYRVFKVDSPYIKVFPEGVTPEQAASWYVNPMTALCFVEHMRRNGHTAIVHTAAASNLGQMLVKLCSKDGIELVNIVRKQEQVDLLKGLGCKHVVNSSSPEYKKELLAAIKATGATIVFDPIGGGEQVGNILRTMDVMLSERDSESSIYGSSTMKEGIIYGMLNYAPVTFPLSIGFNWSISGFYLATFLARYGKEKTAEMMERVVGEIATTFASKYTRVISLDELIKPEVIVAYDAKATGEKFLVNPAKIAG